MQFSLTNTRPLSYITDFANFCIFYALMSRPDPQVDIAFMLMDKTSTGSISLTDFKAYVDSSFDLNTDFVKRFFGRGKELRIAEFSQFLVEFQKEKGRQAFVKALKTRGDKFGYIPAVDLGEIGGESYAHHCDWLYSIIFPCSDILKR